MRFIRLPAPSFALLCSTVFCVVCLISQPALAQSSDGASPTAPKVELVTEPLDIDANGVTDTLTDGILVMRYLFGLRGSALVDSVVGAGAARSAADIENYLGSLAGGAAPTLDIDGDGRASALTDGVMVLRYLFGLRGTALVQGAIAAGATRTTSTQVEAYLATLTASTPHPPSGCSIVASPTSSQASPLAPNTTVQLTANCTGGQSPITYTWDGGAFVGNVRTVTPSSTTTYSLVASNSAGVANTVTATVFVTPAVLQGCDIINVNWPASGQVKIATNGFVNQTIAFRITIPFTFSPPLNITHTGQATIAEVPGQPVVSREFTVSRNSCDFTSGNYFLSRIGTGDTAPSFTFTVNNPNGTTGANTNFQSGDVVYVNIRNGINGSPTCSAFTCDINFDFATPNRF